jgi:hypothetical protein
MNIWRDIVVAVLKVLTISILSTLLMAFVWDVLEWMRNFGDGLPLIPQLSEMQLAGKSTVSSSLIESFINWYNTTFLGAARFGSALGQVMGGFYALGTIKQRGLATHAVCGAIIGALIGGRFALLITSNASLFVFGILAGSLIIGTAAAMIESAPRVPSLPPAQRD